MEGDTLQVVLAIMANVILIATVAALAFTVTPWALLGLMFLMSVSGHERVTVTTEAGTKVEVVAENINSSDIQHSISTVEDVE